MRRCRLAFALALLAVWSTIRWSCFAPCQPLYGICRVVRRQISISPERVGVSDCLSHSRATALLVEQQLMRLAHAVPYYAADTGRKHGTRCDVPLREGGNRECRPVYPANGVAPEKRRRGRRHERI